MKLKNTKMTTQRLASGEVRTYWFHRPSKTALGSDPVEARRKWEELESDQRAGQATGALAARGNPGTIGWLIGSFYENERFERLSPSTRKDYRKHLEKVRIVFGHLPAVAITPQWVEKYREKGKKTPTQTNYRLAILRRVWGMGVKQGAVPSNPFTKPEKLRVERRAAIWSPDDAGTLLSCAWDRPSGRGGATKRECLPDYLSLAFLLGLYTAQREGDVLALTWSAYRVDANGRAWLGLRQRKTGERLDVPVHSALRAVLDRAGPGRGAIVQCDAKPLTEDEFRRRFGRWKSRAGLAHLRFQDLRRTAMVRMAEAGIPTPQIAAISGHSIDQTARILETYIPRTRGMAQSAIESLEAGPALVEMPSPDRTSRPSSRRRVQSA